MKYRPKCGREIREDWRICPYCGHNLSSIQLHNVGCGEPQYDKMHSQPILSTVDGIYLDEKTVEVHAGETVRVELSYLG